MTIQHRTTDPMCDLHRAPRGWLSRWWFEQNRGRSCDVCTPPDGRQRITLRIGGTLWEHQEPEMAAKYRERGMEPPMYSTEESSWAALAPYEPRWPHETYADVHGYFWLPCKLCGRPYGGHEVTMTIPDPDAGPGSGHSICPVCTVERTGGVLT